MQNNNQYQASFERLRKEAETLLWQKQDSHNSPPLDTLELIEELKLHQIELELQNEELLRAKREIEELHQSFADLYEFAPCGYLELGHKGTIIRANLLAVELLGVDKELLLHLSLSSFFAEGFDALYLRAKSRAAETKKGQSVELLLNNTNREAQLWVSAEIAAQFDEQYEVLGWRITLVDITERKEMQKKLEEKEHYIKTALELEIEKKTEEIKATWEINKKYERHLLNQRRIKSLHELMLNVAHHWRQPLTSLSFSIALIQDFMEEDGINYEKYEKQIATMKNSVSFMTNIISSFQHLSQCDVRERFELKATLSELINLTRVRVSEESIEIELSGDDAWLNMNRYKLLDVIQSLIENSKESILIAKTKDQLLQGKIKIEIKNLNDTIQIHTIDNGIGIDESVADAVFDPYFTTKFKYQGVGLSLYFAKLIIESEFQGKIYLNSTFKEGAEFVIELPINQGDICNG